MDRFPGGEHVRLRSRVLGTDLHADTDGAAISLSLRRASMNVAWQVDVCHYDLDSACLLLQGAAYGLYLASTLGISAEPGHHGIHLYQSHHDEPEFEDIMWQVVVSGDDVLLRHVDGGYLRANGKHPDWNDRPTVGDSDGRSMTMRWVVEPIPARQSVPGIPRPLIEEPGNYVRRIWSLWVNFDENEIQAPWRLIRYVPASAHGLYAHAHDSWAEIQFRGNSIFRLRNWMVNEMNQKDLYARRNPTTSSAWTFLDIRAWTSIVMCVRAGRYARLSPMLVDLPGDGGAGETLCIVIIRTGTPGEEQLRYPDIDAE